LILTLGGREKGKENKRKSSHEEIGMLMDVMLCNIHVLDVLCVVYIKLLFYETMTYEFNVSLFLLYFEQL